MKAVIINKFGDLEGSTIKTDLDIPRPFEKEVYGANFFVRVCLGVRV